MNWNVELPSKVKELKEFLLSRDPVFIKNASTYIRNVFCSNEEGIEIVIRNDLPLFLCDATVPSNLLVNSIIYDCLSVLSCNQNLYTGGHATYIVHSMCRLTQFLSKKCGGLSELQEVLKLLNILLIGYETHGARVDDESADDMEKAIERVLSTLIDEGKLISETLIINEYCDIKTLLISLKLYVTLIKIETITASPKLLWFWFHVLNSFNTMDYNDEDGVIYATLLIISKILSQQNFEMEHNDVSMEQSLCSGRGHIDRLLDYLKTKATPNLLALPIEQLAANFDVVTALLQVFVHTFDSLQARPEKLNSLMYIMCLNHILKLALTIIYSQDDDFDEIRLWSWKLLFHLLPIMAMDQFYFPTYYPEGLEHFIMEIRNGIETLANYKDRWLNIFDTKSLLIKSPKLALITLIYFYILAESTLSPFTLESVSSVISNCIDNHLNPNCPILLTKMVWLISAFLQVSKGSSPFGPIETNQQCLFSKLEGQFKSVDDCSVFYTHHPSILFNTFLNYEPVKNENHFAYVQEQVLKCWVKKEEKEVDTILASVLVKSNEARNVALNFFTNNDTPLLILKRLYSTIKQILSNAELITADVEFSVWNVIPSALKVTSVRLTLTAGVMQLIDLACSTRFESPIPNLSELPILIVSVVNDLKKKAFTAELCRLIHRLLSCTLEQSDNRGALIFLKQNNFLQSLVDIIPTVDATVLSPVLKIVVTLSRLVHMEDPKLTITQNVKINLKSISRHLSHREEEVVKSCTLVLHEFMGRNWQNPLFRLNIPPTCDTLRKIFWLLINNCIIYEDISESWDCIRYCLEYKLINHKLRKHFLQHPALICLFSKVVANPNPAVMPAIIKCLIAWLKFLPAVNNRNVPENFRRRICAPRRISCFNNILIAIKSEKIFDEAKQILHYLKPFEDELDKELVKFCENQFASNIQNGFTLIKKSDV